MDFDSLLKSYPNLYWIVPWAGGSALAIGSAVARSRSARARDRWKRLADLIHRDRSLEQTAKEILDLLACELNAPTWALYRYDDRLGGYRLLVSARRGSDNRLIFEGSPEDDEGRRRAGTPIALNPSQDPESKVSPDSLPRALHYCRIGIHRERGLPVLNIPLGPSRSPAGLVQAFPVARMRFTRCLRSALATLCEPLGEILLAVEAHELSRNKLVEIETASSLGAALLGSIFDGAELIERILSVVVQNTRSTIARVTLSLGTMGSDGAALKAGAGVFCAGKGIETFEAEPERWKELEESLSHSATLSRALGESDRLGSLPADHVLGTSIMNPDRTVGALLLARSGGPAYGSSELMVAHAFAAQIGLILENAKTSRMAANSYHKTIQSLVELMDGRLPQTVGHSSRVRRWSVMIGRAAGLAGDDLETLLWSAYFHDVGMCGFEEDLLKKKGKFFDEEAARIRQHPRMGALICDPIRSPKPISPGILTHHERWDGRGYPEGLAGEAIPLHGRIIAVAEFFNAFVSSRHYREPLSFRESIERIKAESGKALDPRLVALFVAAVERENGSHAIEPVESPTGFPRCHEQKGAPAELCSHCPAFQAPEPCWEVEDVLCDRHGDDRCETCFIFTQAKWRGKLLEKSHPALQFRA